MVGSQIEERTLTKFSSLGYIYIKFKIFKTIPADIRPADIRIDTSDMRPSEVYKVVLKKLDFIN